jgi:hypothetical protein
MEAVSYRPPNLYIDTGNPGPSKHHVGPDFASSSQEALA